MSVGSPLSPREGEVPINFAQGMTYRQIARKSGITTNTVDTCLRRVRDKVGAVNSADLIRFAITREDAPN
ncbi:MAG TPA: helix-turn-helix transcriptional regulator [Actinophytocola sp.]|uniref:helix-turn-helix transcriptional regulator n=1 Tax=Actinophytocola sp. TaxID=1872138 RepID=UPI002DBCD70B|nr:helix-turn-helix transcriptional regulator [Actinophytocola sp.]HEU5471087.1 helix-turn-helix transcriptional regulator [Actinophytocola sp.]